MHDQDDERGPQTDGEIRARLEYLRGELRRERISWGELHDLQSLAEHIQPGDVELLEAAGVPEHDAELDDRDERGGWDGAEPSAEPYHADQDDAA